MTALAARGNPYDMASWLRGLAQELAPAIAVEQTSLRKFGQTEGRARCEGG